MHTSKSMKALCTMNVSACELVQLYSDDEVEDVGDTTAELTVEKYTEVCGGNESIKEPSESH